VGEQPVAEIVEATIVRRAVTDALADLFRP